MDDETFTPDRLAAEILRLRKRVRLSQRELARFAGLSPTQVSMMEMGADRNKGHAARPQHVTLTKLARGLATDADEQVDPNAAATAIDAVFGTIGSENGSSRRNVSEGEADR